MFEETVERGSGDRGRVLTGRQGQFAQQSRAGAMRVLALETFDETGQLRSDGAGLSAVLARLGGQCLETAVAVTQRPVEQRIDGNSNAFFVPFFPLDSENVFWMGYNAVLEFRSNRVWVGSAQVEKFPGTAALMGMNRGLRLFYLSSYGNVLEEKWKRRDLFFLIRRLFRLLH